MASCLQLAGRKCMYVGKLDIDKKIADKKIACILVVLKLTYMAAIKRTIVYVF